MHENCNPSDCPVSARVDALEKEFNRYRGNSSDTHRQMFERIGALDGMDEKLDAITEKVNTLAEKPAKRWESIVGYALSALVGAFLLWLASGLPGLK